MVEIEIRQKALLLQDQDRVVCVDAADHVTGCFSMLYAQPLPHLPRQSILAIENLRIFHCIASRGLSIPGSLDQARRDFIHRSRI